MNALTAAEGGTRTRTVSAFEFLPGWLFYSPVVAYWILLGLRYRSVTLPTAANPRIETGGLCGERKTTALDQAGSVASPWIAPYVVFSTGTDDLERAQEALTRAGLRLPIVVKPNIGCNGTGVRLISSVEEFDRALAAFPRHVELVLQELVEFEGEAGVFYVRHPEAAFGEITSLTLKQAPVLIGDGRSTIEELILEDERSKRVPSIYIPRLKPRLHEVLKSGERLRLVFAGNHCKGSIFSDGYDDITRLLTSKIDTIMKDIPDFHFGRIDIRFEARGALRMGERFKIIEINGVGSEATHIWDRNARLLAAYRDQFRHYKMAFQIGAAMRKKGEKPTGLINLFRYWRLQRRLMGSYPLND